MTSSQVWGIVGGAVAVCGAVLQQIDLMPPEVQWAERWIGLVAIVGGALLTLFNQSLAPGHVSIPVAEAKAAGVAESQTKDK